MNTDNNKFRISAFVAEVIKMANFSVPAARLLFALIYFQEQTEEAWPTILVEPHTPQDHFCFVAQLRELGFPAKTKSSRFLRKPVEELACFPGVFDQLEISSNGRYLTWRFAEDFFYAMADMDVYGLIEVREIALCQRNFDGALLAQIPLHRRKRLPEFRLIGPNQGYECPTGYVPTKITPRQVERRLRPSLQIWANATGITFAVMLVQEGSRPGYTDIVIRMQHADTTWPKGRFIKRPATAVMWTVGPLLIEADGESAA
ncbi:hypothetical protein DSM110093_02349 [Sulfitobacter sp. DSM 110093]|uniref:hypothetical protein n=1 Tax=Sulfitobacter sp. DSM 110093 TaxID=2883127 RepID=UPI001FAB9285|nr:hypothetical protein [Sulfitobacter sp. DSM 110093]UOA32549.1 hypothetical protein DSM110093_02349 [Sulfitobacter sp. DSM 110093]